MQATDDQEHYVAAAAEEEIQGISFFTRNPVLLSRINPQGDSLSKHSEITLVEKRQLRALSLFVLSYAKSCIQQKFLESRKVDQVLYTPTRFSQISMINDTGYIR